MTAEKTDLFVGFDVGSSFIHYIVLDRQRNIQYAPEPLMHFANPVGAIKEAWRDIIGRFDSGRIHHCFQSPKTFAVFQFNVPAPADRYYQILYL